MENNKPDIFETATVKCDEESDVKAEPSFVKLEGEDPLGMQFFVFALL